MFGPFANSAMMSPAVVKQFLMAGGVTDPTVLRMVDRVCGGKLSKPSITPLLDETACALRIPEGCESVLIKSENADEELYLLVYSRKKPKKGVDAGMSA